MQTIFRSDHPRPADPSTASVIAMNSPNKLKECDQVAPAISGPSWKQPSPTSMSRCQAFYLVHLGIPVTVQLDPILRANRMPCLQNELVGVRQIGGLKVKRVGAASVRSFERDPTPDVIGPSPYTGERIEVLR